MTDNPMPRIYTDPQQSEETRLILKDLDTLDGKLEEIPDKVTTEEEASIVSEYRAQFNKRIKDLDTERKTMTGPLLEVKRQLDAKYNNIKERAKRAVQLCDNMLRPYLEEKRRIREQAEREEAERKRKEEEAKRAAEEAEREAERIAEEGKDKAALKEAELKVSSARSEVDQLRRRPTRTPVKKSVTGSHGSSVGLQRVWKWKVTDINKVPEEFLVPPEERVQKAMLTKIAKSEKELAYVPGVEFYSEDSVRSRTS